MYGSRMESFALEGNGGILFWYNIVFVLTHSWGKGREQVQRGS